MLSISHPIYRIFSIVFFGPCNSGESAEKCVFWFASKADSVRSSIRSLSTLLTGRLISRNGPKIPNNIPDGPMVFVRKRAVKGAYCKRERLPRTLLLIPAPCVMQSLDKTRNEQKGPSRPSPYCIQATVENALPQPLLPTYMCPPLSLRHTAPPHRTMRPSRSAWIQCRGRLPSDS